MEENFAKHLEGMTLGQLLQFLSQKPAGGGVLVSEQPEEKKPEPTPTPVPEEKTGIGAVVRRRRLAKKFTQQRLGKKLGVHWTVVSRLELGKAPLTQKVLLGMCKVFKVDPTTLLTEAGLWKGA